MRITKGCKANFKQFCFYLFASMIILSLIAFATGASEAQTTGGLPYDDFHQDTIDRTKWQNLEAERGIKNGAVEFTFKQYSSPRSLWLRFNNPNEKNSIQADITVTDLINDDAALRARIGGHFYNAFYGEGGPGNGEQGEIWVQIGVRDSGGGLSSYYSIGRCEDALCNDFTSLVWNDTDFGSVNLNDTHTLSIAWNWDGSDPLTNTFTFSFDGTAVTPTDPLPPVMGPSKARFKGIGERVDSIDNPDEGGTISATFDNVWVNGASYDNFSAVDGMIDRTKWIDGEFVRRVTNGVFESAIARYEAPGSNHLNFLDVGAITAFQADVTVLEVINNGARPRARLSGAFYNDGTPGVGYTGDILAGAVISHDGTQLRAHCYVVRCTHPDCNLPGESETIWWDYLTPDSIPLNETHRLSLRWDVNENKFYFGFDGAIITHDATLPGVFAIPQGFPFNGIGTRVSGIGGVGVPPFEGEGGYIRAEFDNVVLLTDFQPPYTSGHAPAPGATDASIDTNIVVHVRDDGTGVDQSTIVMRVDNVVVAPTISGDVADYTLTYDPPTDFDNEQVVEVSVEAFDLAGYVMEPLTYSFMTEPPIGNPWEPVGDDDEDGIPNDVETDLLGTNPEAKTLFVRPKQLDGAAFVYWPGFIALFPDARTGFANIAAFTHAGIEIAVIGDTSNSYGPMRQFSYDPATDSNQPPCDILEIIYMPDNVYCVYGHHNYGHTYFYNLVSTWYWDTKGYVPNDQVSDHYKNHNYFTPLIYPFPLDNYLNEGAYPQISMDGSPMETTGCGLNQCYDTNYSSPLNLNDSEAAAPYNAPPDGTVEFNQIVFNSNKQIRFVGSQGIRYNRETVMRRTLTHEMGHALLAASERDHCTDVQCIMYHSVADWEMRYFGPGDCVHKPGGSKDIRAKGVVHNSIH